MDELRRFGFFTIPYVATVGDLTYSESNKKKSFKIIECKNKNRKS